MEIYSNALKGWQIRNLSWHWSSILMVKKLYVNQYKVVGVEFWRLKIWRTDICSTFNLDLLTFFFYLCKPTRRSYRTDWNFGSCTMDWIHHFGTEQVRYTCIVLVYLPLRICNISIGFFVCILCYVNSYHRFNPVMMILLNLWILVLHCMTLMVTAAVEWWQNVFYIVIYSISFFKWHGASILIQCINRH